MQRSLFLFTLLPLFLFASCSMSDMKKSHKNPVIKGITNSPVVAGSASVLLGKNYAHKYFYQPKFDYPKTPAVFGAFYEDIKIPSGKETLHGWYIPAKVGTKKATHTVVFSHGNMGTIGYHVKRIKWLHDSGFNVIMYDYRGYGKSTGKITQNGLVQDAAAALRYALNQPNLKHTKIISYGHSLGGAKSTAAIGQHQFSKRLVAVVNESSFASYDDMATKFAGAMGAAMTESANDPVKWVKKINKPYVLIHGTADSLIPLKQAHKMRDAMSGRKQFTYWEIPQANHYNCLSINNGKMRQQLLQILKK